MRSWSIDASIKAAIPFKEPFTVGNCTVEGENMHMKIKAEDSLDLKGIERRAEKEARKFCSALLLATGRLFRFRSLNTVSETAPTRNERQVLQSIEIRGKVVTPSLKSKEKMDTAGLLDLLKNADEYALKSLDYLERGLVLEDWPGDAFLNYYKAVELISMKYFGELKGKDIGRVFRKSQKGVTSKDKINYVCHRLKIPKKIAAKVGTLVDKRNRQDVGHAKLSKGNIGEQDEDDCMQLAILLVVNHLKTLAKIN